VTPRRTEIDGLLRELAPQAVAALVRRHRRFDACQDAVQEALLAAARQWPQQGVPQEPLGWLVAVATRRLIDEFRSDSARRAREDATFDSDEGYEPAFTESQPPESDDTLTLLFLCCHPSLTAASQIALTLRAVGGLTTAQIATAFLVPETTIAQRISRAKQTIKENGTAFVPPSEADRADRLAAVRHVLYLIFNEGYTASSGPQLQTAELAEEAIRLTRLLYRLLPADGENAGLLALMLLTHARRDARVDDRGRLVPLAEQDRSRWDHATISEGVTLIERALARAPVGPYQLQGAIAAAHAEAATSGETDWEEIVTLYTLLGQIQPNPIFALNRAVAVAMAHGADAGLAELARIETDERLARHHRLHAVRAHMLELAGEHASAAAAYQAAARLTTSLPERRYLEERAAAL